jgi:hypothetical protein
MKWRAYIRYTAILVNAPFAMFLIGEGCVDVDRV